MIRRGKTEGWLQLPAEAVLPWAMLNEVAFVLTVPGTTQDRGSALLAKEDLHAEDTPESRLLLTVPRDLILSLERVQEHAKTDKSFREVLESLGDFGRTPRGAILSFLLAQASISCPDIPGHVVVPSAFSDYVKSLPMEPLPTFWTPEELQLLIGTTLAPAVSAKLRSLQMEYDLLCSSAEHTRWYQIVQDHLEFDDWLQVDAMYRSRALDFPEIGHCMAPCIDLANHAGGEATVALYERDLDGDAILVLRDGKQVRQGEEVTITYGDEKGACEMIFSYGFLEDSMDSAATVFLSLNIPDDDKFRRGKASIAECAPGFKILERGKAEIDWTGDFVWLLCVNEDDGLRFELARTVDSRDEDMQALFGEHEISGGAAELHTLLQQTELWDVYRLRAVTILQQRVFHQLQVLYNTQNDVEAVPYGEGTDIRSGIHKTAMKLRQLEFELLENAYETFEVQISDPRIWTESMFREQKTELVESPEVVRFLARMNETADPEPCLAPEDFS